MPVVNRDITVQEGQPVVIRISDEDVESYSYSARSRDGTARLIGPDGNSDYRVVQVSGSGTRAFVLSLPTEDDEIYEGTTAETFFVDYTAAITTLEGDPPDPVVTPYSGTVTVHIDDAADKPKLEIHPIEIKEDDKLGGRLTITADHPATFDYTIHVTIAGGRDVETTTYDVVMKAMSQVASIDIRPVDDFEREASPTTLAENYENLTVTATSDFDSVTGDIKIINDDGPVVTITPVGGSEISAYEGFDFGKAQITLSKAVPYDIELLFAPTDALAFDEVNFPQVIIKAGTLGGEINVLSGLEDHEAELTENIGLKVTALPLAGTENVYFGPAGQTSTTVDARVQDAIKRILDNKGDMAEEVAALDKVLGVKNTFIAALLKYSQDPDYSKFAKSIEDAGTVLSVGLNVAPIVANYLAERGAAEGKPNQSQLNNAAAIHAVVDFFDATAALAFAEGASALAAGIIVAFGLTGAVVPVLATVGVGLATAYVYETYLSAHLKDAVSNLILLNYDENSLPEKPSFPALPKLNQIESQDGGNTYAGDSGDNLFIVSASTSAVSEAEGGGYDVVAASADFNLPSNVEAIFLTGNAKTATGNALDNLLVGNAVDNLIYGGAGRDFISGGLGNDFLAGQGGEDALAGGAGKDTFSGTLGNLDGDRIAGYELGEKILIAAGPTSIFSYRIEHTATDTLVRIDADGDGVFDSTITLSGVIEGSIAVSQESDPTVTNDDTGAVYASLVISAGILVEGTNASETLEGTSGDDEIYGFGGDDAINGGDGVDHLIGGTGADLLDGGIGADVMHGGRGADTYVVENAGDVVDEAAAESGGKDTVRSSITFSLAASATVLGRVENVTLTGSGFVDAVGNELANILIGNDADNVLLGGLGKDTLIGNGGDDQLDGGAGSDKMRGGAGDDVYLVDRRGDRVNEAGGSGTDAVLSSVTFSLASGRVAGEVERLGLVGTGNINAIGNALSNTLTGNSGDNVLDGRAGADVMLGGLGNDTYIVDNVGDVINEPADVRNDTDTVRASVSYTLSNNVLLGPVENLVLTGRDSLDGTGNDWGNAITGNGSANVLSGGSGNDVLNGKGGGDTLLGGSGTDTLSGGRGADTLDGGTGPDTMAGGTGSDLYVVDDAGDSISENAREGRDTVQTPLLSFALSDNVENLVFIGVGGFTGTGNASKNTITGGAGSDNLSGGGGNDVLTGGAESDILTGGAGADWFMFSTPLDTSGVDTITDFVTRAANPGVHDRIALSNSAGMFTQLQDGTLSNAGFAVENGGQAQDSSDRIVYDPTTGWLTYDENGSAAGGTPFHFATLQPGLTLHASDFLVV
ncbi:hypothetical protein HFO09_09020 [Rhizobium laguerreae]|uniref:calcium-binding protein n=1 Tax=Rhizobium laguerreae TaxID=1076926 RepID=UPI001C91EE4C|nr:calcium-binding protein [Rhizobium laguerreae]MBY3259866.1 hypothetical protein [Rhizobium laguerreae]MBY3282863.1 hypothetical protein [Rhizobium laguerreae]MBY3289217.1 hypothetical protein [Rhizobium laguerreae]